MKTADLPRTNPLDISDRVAVVIGGTSGLGEAIALGMADAGASVVASGRRADRVAEVSHAIRERGRPSIEQTVDVRDRASVEALCTAVLEHFGRVDVLVNAAGVTRRQPTAHVSEADWSSILDTNLNGILRACQVFRGPLKESGRGRIINIASVASYRAFHEVAAYCASKAAVLSLSRSLGAEWAREGIMVNAIAPGVFPTQLNRALLEGTDRGNELIMRTPSGRFGRPDELVGTAILLASDGASFITGECIAVDGGFLASGVNT